MFHLSPTFCPKVHVIRQTATLHPLPVLLRPRPRKLLRPRPRSDHLSLKTQTHLRPAQLHPQRPKNQKSQLPPQTLKTTLSQPRPSVKVRQTTTAWRWMPSAPVQKLRFTLRRLERTITLTKLGCFRFTTMMFFRTTFYKKIFISNLKKNNIHLNSSFPLSFDF